MGSRENYVREHNVTGELSITHLMNLTEEVIGNITPENWRSYVEHVRKIEDKYWEIGGKIENSIDEIIIRLGPSESSEDSTTTDSDDEEYDVTLSFWRL